MPVRLDEICAEPDDAQGTDPAPGEPQRPSLPAVWPPPLLELPGYSIAAMAADAVGGAHLSLGDSVASAFASAHQSPSAEASVHRALASQFDPFRSFTGTAAMLASSMDQSAAVCANFASNALAMGAAAGFPPTTFGGAGLTLLSDLYLPHAVLATNILNAFAARPPIQDLLPGLGLAGTLADTARSLLHQMAFPLHEAAQRLLDVQRSAWRFDASRLWVSSVTDLADRLAETLFPADGPWGDLQVLFLATADPTAIDPVRVEEAVNGLVGEIPWRVHDRRVWRAIAERAEAEGTSPGAVMRQELRASLFLAVATRDAPQTVRLGAEWVTDDDGRKAALAPHELPMRWFWQWLYAKAIAIAEASLLERPYAGSKDVLDRPAVASVDEPGGPERHDAPPWVASYDDARRGIVTADLADRPDADPLLALLAWEARAEAGATLRSMLAKTTPSERQFLLALLAADGDRAEAARQLGIAPSTARVHWHNIRHKVG